MSRAWSLDETKEVLMRAAWVCIKEGSETGDVTLDVNRVLDVASSLWQEDYPTMKRRVFTRGAIMNIWGSIGKFQRECVVEKLRLYEEGSIRSANELRTRLSDVHNLPEHDLEEEIEDAVVAYGKAELESRVKVAEVTQYLRLLSRHGLRELQMVIHTLYQERDRRTTEALTRVCDLIDSPVSPREVAIVFNTLIEGASIRMTVDQSYPKALERSVPLALSKLPSILFRQPLSKQDRIGHSVVRYKLAHR